MPLILHSEKDETSEVYVHRWKFTYNEYPLLLFSDGTLLLSMDHYISSSAESSAHVTFCIYWAFPRQLQKRWLAMPWLTISLFHPAMHVIFGNTKNTWRDFVAASLAHEVTSFELAFLTKDWKWCVVTILCDDLFCCHHMMTMAMTLHSIWCWLRLLLWR